MVFPDDRKYTKTHEWAKLEDNLVRVGISSFAVDKLGDIVFLDLPDIGTSITREDSMGEIESVKAVADLYAPVSGEVVEVNSDLMDDLDIVAHAPYEDAWLLLIKAADLTELDSLLDAAAYEKLCKEEAGQ